MVSFPQLRNALAGNFVNSQKFAETASLSLVSNIPVIYTGKGGYGKTESILTTMKAVTGWKWGMLEASPETVAGDFLGGAVARTERNGNIDITSASYNVEKSMLQKDAFFIEEMMDASFNALSALKAMITNKGATVNDEWVESQLKWLVAATNVDPVAFMQSLPATHQNSYDALLQRFLIVRQEWDSHTADDYKKLINFTPTSPKDAQLSLEEIMVTRQLRDEVQISRSVADFIAELAAKSTENGSTVSPRNFMWALNLLKSAAVLSGRSVTKDGDIHVIQYITAFDSLLIDGLKEEIERKQKINKTLDKVAEFEAKLLQFRTHLLSNPKHLNPHFLGLSVVASIKSMFEEFENTVTYDDSMSRRIHDFRDSAYALQEQAEKIAADNFSAYDLN